MPQTYLFTPRATPEFHGRFPTLSTEPSDTRIKLTVSADDHFKIARGLDWSAIVTDVPSGAIFHVTGADCGLNCFCAAQVVAELTTVPRERWPRVGMSRW